jgi:Fe-S-cluster containining protein
LRRPDPEVAAVVAPPEHEHAHCSRCDAVCCRLTVVVMPEDNVPGHLLERRDGLTVMARDEEGWCVALDSSRMCCSIYESRPDVCRRFVMDGPYCRSVREDYSTRRAIGIELVMH